MVETIIKLASAFCNFLPFRGGSFNLTYFSFFMSTLLIVDYGWPQELKPTTKLERKVVSLISVLDQLKKKKTTSVETLGKKKVKIFYKIVDIELITKNVLAEHFNLFTPTEIKSFQEGFLSTVFTMANKKTKVEKYRNLKMKFVDYAWEKDTRIVAIEAKLTSAASPILLILEFDKKKDILIDFYFAELSLVNQYKEQFDQIISTKGKEAFLSLIQNKANDNE